MDTKEHEPEVKTRIARIITDSDSPSVPIRAIRVSPHSCSYVSLSGLPEVLRLMRTLLLLLGVLAAFTPFRAAAQYGATTPPKPATTNLTCTVCAKTPLTGKYWRINDQPVCADCQKLEARCSICRLPVKAGFSQTDDGRLICARDLPNAVLKVDEARLIFAETAASLRYLAGGALTLRSTNLTVNLFDVDVGKVGAGKDEAGQMRKTGVSHTRQVGSKFTHLVLLLSGQLRADLPAVCAHEFTHLWINENKPATRELEPDTIEAVCELVAYRLVGERRDAAAQEKIRKNTYTNGRIETLIAAEAATGLAGVLEWVKTGQGKTYGGPAVQIPLFTAARPAVAAPAVPLPTAPAQLELVGLIGGRRQQAIINGVTFLKNDELKVRLGDKTVVVKCVDFQDKAVVIRVNGAEKTTTLRMDGR